MKSGTGAHLLKQYGTHWFAKAVLGMALLVAIALLVRANLYEPVSFDGGMNLQVAQSLAEGKGYARDYRGHQLFPQEVQTNSPYIIPSALVFKIFGVGFWQSQIVNLAYLLSLMLLVGVIVRHYFHSELGVLAGLVILTLPGVYDFGMNGYGEVAALFWWLWGTYVLLGIDDSSPPSLRNAFIGGAMLALALLTKTVILIGVAGTLAIYALWMLIDRRWLRGTLAILVIICGLSLPILIVEIWRYEALGGIYSYLNWWTAQHKDVADQAGVASVFSSIDMMIHKLLVHLKLLSQLLGLPVWLLSSWLILPPLLSTFALYKGRLKQPLSRVWAAILLVALIYILWWLVITPSDKAWLRRIVNGLILLQLCWIFVFAWGWKTWIEGTRRIATPILLGSVLIAGSSFVVFSADYIKHARADIAHPSTTMFQALEIINGLPANARMFGQGWNGVPNIALYSRRQVEDIDRYSAYELEKFGTGYLLLDKYSQQANAFDRILKRFPTEALLNQNPAIQIYKVDFSSRQNPFNNLNPKPDKVLSSVNFTEQLYELTYGFYQSPVPSAPWVTTDAEILLRYQGGNSLELRAYRPALQYVKHGEVNIQVHINDCLIGTASLPSSIETLMSFRVPAVCLPKSGTQVRVRIQSDNMIGSGEDYRQLSYLISAIGFIKQ